MQMRTEADADRKQHLHALKKKLTNKGKSSKHIKFILVAESDIKTYPDFKMADKRNRNKVSAIIVGHGGDSCVINNKEEIKAEFHSHTQEHFQLPLTNQEPFMTEPLRDHFGLKSFTREATRSASDPEAELPTSTNQYVQ